MKLAFLWNSIVPANYWSFPLEFSELKCSLKNCCYKCLIQGKNEAQKIQVRVAVKMAKVIYRCLLWQTHDIEKDHSVVLFIWLSRTLQSVSEKTIEIWYKEKISTLVSLKDSLLFTSVEITTDTKSAITLFDRAYPQVQNTIFQYTHHH